MALSKDELGKLLKIDEQFEHAGELEAQMAQPGFWADSERARQISQEYASIQKLLDRYWKAETEAELQELELETLFTGPHDDDPALVSIHAGAGGTEAQDWTEMLLRMYQRYAEKRGWRIGIYDQSLGEEAGIKSVTFRVEGEHAYGIMKAEAGVHRLVRISPFDADKARHTSFALLEVIPEIKHTDEIEIDDKDLKMDLYHAGGKGGQNVNKVATAVRITHLPTGLVAASQIERGQAQNREIALQMLKAKLLVKMEEERASELKELRGEYRSAEWGNQIRSYVLQPYQLVKDHRTDVETGNTEAVLNGDIDLFIEGYLRWKAETKTT